MTNSISALRFFSGVLLAVCIGAGVLAAVHPAIPRAEGILYSAAGAIVAMVLLVLCGVADDLHVLRRHAENRAGKEPA